MSHGLFAVLDRKSEIFSSPFAHINGPSAARAIQYQEGVNPTTYSQFPEDFVLVQVAKWDQATGACEGLSTWHPVAELKDILKRGEE